MKKQRTIVNDTSEFRHRFSPELYRDYIFPFVSTVDVGSACAAFDWPMPMDLLKYRVESNLIEYVPQLIDGLSKIVTENGTKDSIVISGGSALGALYGAVDVQSDLDIWCEKCVHPSIRKVLVSQGYVLSRMSTRYGMNSSSLISHVETYYAMPQDSALLKYRCFGICEQWDWRYSDRNALANGQVIINYALRNNRCNRLLQFSNVDRTTLALRFEPSLMHSSSVGTKVDVIIGRGDKKPEEVIMGSFDLTACLVRYSIRGDLRMEFPTFTLAKTSLLCLSGNRIVMMHYMHKLADLARLPNEDAIKKFVRVRRWFRPMFKRHLSEILEELQSCIDKGGFFASQLDVYSEYRYYMHWGMSDEEVEFCRTIWIVVYSARHHMIVDALRHVETLRIGHVQHPSFRYDHDGTCDWAIKTHNNICYSKNVDRLIKYTHRGLNIPQMLDMRDIHNREVTRNLRQL